MSKIIVISVHPDDEALGCGGTLLKHSHNGDELYWLIVTGMHTSQGFSEPRIKQRQEEIKTVSEKIGFKEVFELNYPTMTLDSSSLLDMIPKISKVFLQVNPDTVYTVNRSDAHSDHRIVFEAVMACSKSFRYPSVRKIFMYECISETEFSPALPENTFIPNYFVDISQFFSKKLEIISVYNSEIGEHPFPRSLRNVEALATYRGAFAGVEYAEAFHIIKYIDK